MAYDTYVEESIDIAVPPEVVYDTILDITRWGRFSPECTGATVLAEPGPLRPGSRFSGHNRRNAIRRWSTRCVVTAVEPGRLFTFDSGAIGLAIATWSYRLEPLDGGSGTRVTEIWQDNRGRLMRGIAVVVSGIRDRATHNRGSMRVTLRRLKEHLEREHGADTASTAQQAAPAHGPPATLAHGRDAIPVHGRDATPARSPESDGRS